MTTSTTSRSTTHTDSIARAVVGSLQSPNETDSNGEVANVVDGLFAISRAIHRLAAAVETITGKELA